MNKLQFCSHSASWLTYSSLLQLCIMGPCHHGMTPPQVAGGGTASNMEGSCDCIE